MVHGIEGGILWTESRPNLFFLFASFDSFHLPSAIGNILNFLVMINAACNFILYCALSAKYRQTVKDIIFRRGRLKRQVSTERQMPVVYGQ